MIDLNKIEAAAKAATPGPWEAAGPSFGEPLPKYLDCVGVVTEDDEFDDVCIAPHLNDDTATENMTHIATSNPATVLEMVSMIRERDAVLKQALEALEGLFGVPEQWTGKGAGGVHVWNLGGSFAPKQAITAIKEVLE